ncbi:MAG: serine hydrolase domain-containing protein, partial [Bacteroidota bacterium]
MSFLKYTTIIFLLLTSANAMFGQMNSHDDYQVALQQIRLNFNEKSVIPLKNLETLAIAHLVLGTAQVKTNIFSNQIDKYAAINHYQLPLQDDLQNLESWLKSRKSAGENAFILEIWTTENFSKDKLMKIKTMFDGLPVINVNFETAYFDRNDNTGNSGKFDIQTRSGYWHQSLAAQLIFGGISLENGMEAKGVRLGYSPIASVGMKANILHDSIKFIIEQGIAARAFPGAQVLVARKGKIVYHEAFGKHTYEGEQKLSPDDIYDMASVTKVSSGLAALMKWYGEDKLNLDAPLSTYLPESKGTNKADLKMRDILTHQARLRAWIPFWKGTLVGNSRNPWQKNWNNNRNNDYRFKPKTFRLQASKNYDIEVPGGLWLHKNYPDKIASYIFKSPLNAKPGYVYSDFFFILMPRLVKAQTGQDFESYIKTQFYKPLGANTLTWNPLRFFDTTRIVPTERDTFFRMTLLQGNVHDEGAGMLNGISGHAGLFGSANDLAKLMQLYLNKGVYGGERLIGEKAFDEFTRCQFCPDNYRGVGFDKPLVQY